MSENPYRIDRPGIVSFSGGRTSGFMLRQILDAYEGTLPEDIRVVFCNTGLEHPATYRFIETVSQTWGVPITWLEYRPGRQFVEVTPETSSRNGEPYAALIKERGYLPNPVTRFCTVELKIRTTARFVASLGWDDYTNAVGLRADEMHRVARMKGDRAAETVVCPMAKAGHGIIAVRSFWSQQRFDLQLPGDWNGWGNCVGCFLKGGKKIEHIATVAPEYLAWWADQEAQPKGKDAKCDTFRIDRPSYAKWLEIGARRRTQGELFPPTAAQAAAGDDLSCMCTE